MGTSGSLNWLLLRGLMHHTDRAREEDIRENGGICAVYTGRFNVIESSSGSVKSIVIAESSLRGLMREQIITKFTVLSVNRQY